MKLAECLWAVAFVTIASAAVADSRVFIVANQPDSYGIDQCLASGERCGVPAASAYCEARDFKTASAFRRIDPDEVTGALPASAGERCSGRACATEYVAITCER